MCADARRLRRTPQADGGPGRLLSRTDLRDDREEEARIVRPLADLRDDAGDVAVIRGVRDDRDPGERRIRSQLPEERASVHAGKVEVEDDERGPLAAAK